MTKATNLPTTEAGRRLLDGFAPLPLPDAPELHRRSAMGRRNKLTGGILDAVFAAPGDFGPAKAYYGEATGHFMDMLRAEYARQTTERTA